MKGMYIEGVCTNGYLVKKRDDRSGKCEDEGGESREIGVWLVKID